MKAFYIAVALASAASAFPRSRAAGSAPEPTPGKTVFNLGQNYLNEFQDFVSGSGKTPSGISVYGNIYIGELTPEAMELVEAYAKSNPGGIVQVGLSWKDDMTTLGGYSEFQGATLQYDIADGKWDEGLNKLGDYLAQFDLAYMLRPDYEVTGNQHANTNPNGYDQSTFDTKAYPAAFKHVRDNLSAKMPNMKFIYHPMRSNAELLYPGDDVVDLQGISLFNNDLCFPVADIRNCDGGVLDGGAAMDLAFAKKPLVVSESGSQPPYSDTAAGSIEFFERLVSTIEQYDFAYWFYINSNWPAHGWPSNVWGDTRIEAKPELLEWFNEKVVSSDRYVFEA